MLTLKEKAKAFDDICDLFELGSQARGRNVLVNIRNCKGFTEKLHAIEREYFMTEGEPDEDYPNEAPEPVCMVNSWGDNTQEYVLSFGAALNRIYNYDQLIKRNADLDKAICEEIENRDHWEERASKLAYAVGEYFGESVGEHSSANCPINNAHELLNQVPIISDELEAIKGTSTEVKSQIEYGMTLAAYMIAGANLWPWHKGYKPRDTEECSHHLYGWEECGFLKHAVGESLPGDFKSPLELIETVKKVKGA